jgi:dinuclear metal center YbgI/SA1388 family protein
MTMPQLATNPLLRRRLGFYWRMPKTKLSQIVGYCDKLLRTSDVQDYEGACNGLQVENEGSVTLIAAMVDATLATVREAVAAGADLLLVHHGLFWSPSHPWTGKRYELLRLLLDNSLAVYSSHLPLDAHPTLGNNAQLCAALRLKKGKPFLPNHGQPIGFRAKGKLSLQELAERLKRATGVAPRVVPGGPKTCREIGIVSGGAGADVRLAAEEGLDTFVTGEGPHWTFGIAEELGINILYGGHYATETFGVKALARHISIKFHVPWVWLEHPTGL